MIRKFTVNIFHILKVATNETSTLQTICTWIALTEQTKVERLKNNHNL